MRLTELRKEYKEATGEDWNTQIGVYVNFLERKLISPLNQGQTLPMDSIVGKSEQVKCPYCKRDEPCKGSYPEGCFHPNSKGF